MARKLTNCEDGFLDGKRYLMDCDGQFTAEFRQTLQEAGTTPVWLPPRSLNLNAHIERWFLGRKSELLERRLFLSEASLRRAVLEHLHHHHGKRNHQGLGNRTVPASPHQ